MTRALLSDTVKNPKLNVNPTSSVSSACSYSMEDPQSSSRPLNSINAIKTCSKQTNDFQKGQPKFKTLTVNEIGTPKSNGPEQTLEDEFKDLHLNLPVLEVLAHAPIYNEILAKYVKSLELGRGFLATANAVIDYKKANIAVGEGITRSIFGVKGIDLELIEKRIDWNRPPKEGDGAWHIRIQLIDPDGEKFNKNFQSISTTRKLSEKENPSEIIDLDHFHNS
ncbi:hypothetical protein Tco_0083906 [Tanacetum coccineum]